MDVISEQVYLPSYRRRRNPKTTAAMVIGSAGLVYILEKRYGVLDGAWKTFTRGMMALIAAWMEELGGVKLFSLKGNEPPEPDPAQYFKSMSPARTLADRPNASTPGTPRPISTSSSTARPDLDVPEFLMSTKFFACLELMDARKVAEAATTIHLQPHSLVFSAGDDSTSGIYVVVEGSLGVFLADGTNLVQTNTLRPGESVGDLDIIDGARRSITCVALGEGAVLVQLPRSLFLAFLAECPSALHTYLKQGVARLWRVANFILSDYLKLPAPLKCPPPAVAASEGQRASSIDHQHSYPMESAGGTPMAAPAPRSGVGVPVVVPHLLDGTHAPAGGLHNSPDWAGLALASTSSPKPAGQAHGHPGRRAEGRSPPKPPPGGAGFSGAVADSLAPPPTTAGADSNGGEGEEASEDGQTVSQELIAQSTANTRSPAGSRSGSSDGADRDSSDNINEGTLPSSASAMAMAERVKEAARQRQQQQQEAALAGRVPAGTQVDIETMEVLNRVLKNVPADTGGDWLSRWQDCTNCGPGSNEGAAGQPVFEVERESRGYESGRGSLGHASEMVYVRQRERNKGMLLPSFQLQPQPVEAFAAAGWDCVNPAEAQLGRSTVAQLKQNSHKCVTAVIPTFDTPHFCRAITLVTGSELLHQGRAAWQVLLILDGSVTLERTVRGEKITAVARAGSLLGATSFLCSSPTAEKFTAASTCTVLAVSNNELKRILQASPAAYLDLLFAASKALGYYIRRFVSLGLNRVWTRSGDMVYQQGVAADCMYVVISGRVRLVTKQGGKVHVEEEVGRGQAIGAIWAISNLVHDTSAITVRDTELVRFSRESFEVISRSAPEAAAVVLSQMAARLLNARRVRMNSSRATGRVFTAAGSPSAAARGRPSMVAASAVGGSAPSSPAAAGSRQQSVLEQRGEIATIAVVPAGSPPTKPTFPMKPVRRLCNTLKSSLEESEGSCTILTWSNLNVWFPQVCNRLQVPFYRTKVTSWMASLEEEYRFIILEADPSEDPDWAQLCVEQADCILLVAAENGGPEQTAAEHDTVWKHVTPPPDVDAGRLSQHGQRDSHSTLSASKMSSLDLAVSASTDSTHGACFTADADDEEVPEPINKYDWLRFARRVELVLLQDADCKTPENTLAWLQHRPQLVRHHHVRLNQPKQDDVRRLCRWVAGKAVGLVLSGGGSRGLAHLGVLQALDDVGIPVDVVGGTSQGAFMAALYAQNLSSEELRQKVRSYATQMASPRHLLSDITLPVLSLFSGKLFDRALQETFSSGPQKIEDLWLPFFCVSTNLSRSQVQVHQLGSLWQYVRASMTIVGMLPPVISGGEMLVDGGYLNNVPVDVMQSLGVKTVIVVDVEDKQSGSWHTLTPYDGGLSGWRLLWDRYCPIPGLRFGASTPRYRELVNALSWIAHSHNLRRMCQDYRVDLYLRPPNIGSFKLMDYHLIDRLVRDSYRYSWGALNAWVERRQPTLRNRRTSLQSALSSRFQTVAVKDEAVQAKDGFSKPWSSVSGMQQLKGKQTAPASDYPAASAATGTGRWLVVQRPRTTNDASPTDRESAFAPPASGNGATGAAEPDQAHHQSPSLDSLTEAAPLPVPGEAARYTESELMRAAKSLQEAAAGSTSLPDAPPAPSTDAAAALAAPSPAAKSGEVEVGAGAPTSVRRGSGGSGGGLGATSKSFSSSQHLQSLLQQAGADALAAAAMPWVQRSQSAPIADEPTRLTPRSPHGTNEPDRSAAPLPAASGCVPTVDVPSEPTGGDSQYSLAVAVNPLAQQQPVPAAQEAGSTGAAAKASQQAVASPGSAAGSSQGHGASGWSTQAATDDCAPDVHMMRVSRVETAATSSRDASGGSPLRQAAGPSAAAAAERPESPNSALARRRSSRPGTVQLHTITETDNEDSAQ